MSVLGQAIDTISLLPIGGPGCCNFAVTNACNANCDFCNYARDKTFVTERVFVDYDKACQAMDILYDRGIRFLTFSGGEPTLHPKLKDMVAYAVKKGMRPSVVTNGGRLTPALLNDLKNSGLKTMFISIDSPSAEEHEKNRGLPNVWARIKEANVECKRLSIKTIASVTINRLIKDFSELVNSLKDLGFETVTFSYPKRAPGSSLVYSETSELVDFTTDELIQAFETVQSLKGKFGVLNPRESLADMVRLLKNEKQMFPCYGGYKYFYLDCNLDVYRCDSWPTKMSSIFEFRDQPFIRDNCTKCMSDCYRDASMLMHPAISVGDAIENVRKGQVFGAIANLGKPSNALSLKTLLEDWSTLNKLAKIDTSSQGN